MWTVAPGATAFSMKHDQAVRREIVDALQSNPPKTPRMLDPDSDRDDRLGVGLPAEHATFNPTQLCLVNLDVPGSRSRPGPTIAVR